MKNMVNEFSMREKSIVFIGFMGVGKTSVAQLVAKKLYRDFVDIDQEIEREYGIPTTEIFERFGEATFRQKEKEYVFKFSEQPLKIIASGGGAFLQKEIREQCLDN